MWADYITERLVSHPKLVSTLFMSLIVLTQASIVIADNNGGGTGGP